MKNSCSFINYFLIILVCALFFPFYMQAQTLPTVAWDKTLGGNGDEYFPMVIQTNDGGFIVGGSSDTGINGDKSQVSFSTIGYAHDIWIVKLDPNGNKIWDKTYGGNAKDLLISMQQTNDGGFILGGESNSGPGNTISQGSKGNEDYWILRLDANGNKLWDKSFGTKDKDLLSSVYQTSDGGFIVGGSSDSGIGGDKSQTNQGGIDYWILKLDGNGNKQWDKTFGGNKNDNLRSVQQTTDGGYIAVGFSNSSVSGDKLASNKGKYDYWIIKLDANGDKLWDKSYGGSEDDTWPGLQLTSDGGFIIGGTTFSGVSGDKSQSSRGAEDLWILRLDAAGTIIWEKTVGGNKDDRFTNLQQTPDGGFVLGGFSESGVSGEKSEPPMAYWDYWLIKLDANGSIQWDKVVGANDKEILSSMHQTSDGGYILSGYANSFISGYKTEHTKGGFDYWVVKLNAPCTELSATLSGSCQNSSTQVKVHIRGIQQIAGSQSWTLNYTINGISQVVSGYSPDFVLAQNASPGTIISLFSISSGSCSLNLSETFIVEPIPGEPIATDGNNCSGQTVKLFATGAPVGGSYVWYDTTTGGTALHSNPSGTFVTPQLTESKIYYVAILNNGGCEGPRTAVTANIFSIDINAGKDETLCVENGPVQLIDFYPAGGTWKGPGISATGVFTPERNLIGKRFVYYSITENGCTFTDSLQVIVRNCNPPFIPNVVTLNGDNKNDTFRPQSLSAGNWQLQIFNRWGNKVFESENYQNNWPGTKISEGMYFYLLKNPETGVKYKGWMEVIF